MDDKEIIELFFRREQAALSETAEKYGNYCRSVAFNILHSEEDSKECENDALNALWNTIPPSRPDSLKVFAGKVTRNIALSRYDYNTAKKRNTVFDAVLHELEDCVSSAENVENTADFGLLSGKISEFLSSTDKSSRIMFVRRYWYADSIAEIASRMKMSESRVKSNLFRTRRKLGLYLEKEGFSV